MLTIAFYKGTKEENPGAKLFDMAVCWLTEGRFSHCELVIERKGPYALCWSSSFRDGGVRLKWINIESGRWELAEFDANLEKAKEWFEAHKGKGYDVFGLLGFVLPFRVSYRRWWFCSESCAEALGFPNSWEESPVSLYEKRMK